MSNVNYQRLFYYFKKTTFVGINSNYLKIRSMKKSITLLTLLFIAMFSFAQTSNENITIKKRNGRIINVETNEKLSKLELKSMLDEESYDSYIRGRNRYIASIPFWAATAVEGAFSITYFSMGNRLKNDCINNHDHQQEKENGHDVYCENGTGAMLYWVIGGFFAAGAVMYAIPSTILTISSHRKLNAAVDGHNHKSSDLTLNFGATNNGLGVTLKF